MDRAVLSVSLLGTFQVTLDGETVTDFGSDTARALLAYLAMHPDTAHRREALAGLLWPEVPESDARRNLRVTLSRLRDAIHDREAQPPFLEITRNTITLPRDTGCTVDVWRFLEALEAVKSHKHVEDRVCDVCAGRLWTMDDLYRGEFLAGFSLDSAAFEAWVVSEGERLHWEVIEALTSLTAYHEAKDDYDEAIVYARRQVELEPWREVAHRQWMRALASAGRRNAALAQYETCRQVLSDELGLEPEVDTVALYEQIRAGALKSTGVSSPTTAPDLAAPVGTLIAPDGVGRSLGLSAPTGGATSGSADPERRRVTVVQAEICGSSALLTQVDMEDWAAILSQLLQAAGAEVRRYGGAVERYEDDRLTALFGATAAHEDDPERAVLAALGVLDAFESQLTALATATPDWREDLLALDARAAVHTGEVVVAGAGDGGNRPAAMGDAILVVRRMLTEVPPGDVRTSESTYRLTAPLFDWTEDGGRQGHPRYRPIARKPSVDKGRGIPGMRSPLVGRDGELTALREALDQLVAGHGGIVTLTGEAGIGKSRLVAEMRETRRDLIWMEGRCRSHSGATAYALWISALRNMLGVHPDTPPIRVGQVLRGYLADLSAGSDDFDGAYPFLAHLLGAAQAAEDQAMLAQLDAEVLREAIFSTLGRLLAAMATQTALVVVCEDLHWADSLSLQLLERLLALPDRAPLLLLCIFRPERQHPCWQIRVTALRDHADRHTDLQLRPLSDADGERLLRNLLGSVPGPEGRSAVEALPEALKARILARCEGNPYYVEEILRSLIESGAIVCDAAACAWEAGPDAAEVGIPDTLYGVLHGRIDRLPPAARQIAQLGSVIGRSFSYRLLAAIADRSGLPEALGILQREELIRERSGAPESAYVFKHQLTRDAVYASLLRRVRRVLHRRVAEALERLYAGRMDEQLSPLAYHWEEAGETARAIDYLRRAAERAAAQYANTEALSLLDRALALAAGGDEQVMFDLLCSRVSIHDRLGARSEQGADIDRLRDIAEETDPGDPVGQCRRAAVARLEVAYYEHIQDREALRLAAERALALARTVGDLATEIEAESAWGIALSDSMNGRGARKHLGRALKLAEQSGHRQLEARVLRSLAIGYDVVPFDTSWRYLLRALQIHRETDNRGGEAVVLNALAVLSLHHHQPALAKQYVEEGMHLCRLTGLHREEGWALAQLGWALHDLAVYEEGDRWAAAAVELFQEVDDPYGESVATVVRGWIANQLGDDDRSRAYCERGVQLADAAGAIDPSIVGRVALGHALVGLCDLESAVSVFYEARARARRYGRHNRKLGAHVGLARVALVQDAPDKALTDVQVILDYMESNRKLLRTFQPVRTYLTCFRVLQALTDPRAGDVLGTGYRLLMEWAEEIEDSELRTSFLQDVPAHRALRDTYEQHR